MYNATLANLGPYGIQHMQVLQWLSLPLINLSEMLIESTTTYYIVETLLTDKLVKKILKCMDLCETLTNNIQHVANICSDVCHDSSPGPASQEALHQLALKSLRARSRLRP